MASDDDPDNAAQDTTDNRFLHRRRKNALLAAAHRAWTYAAVLDGMPADELEELEEFAKTYKIADDGKSITCLTCGSTSHNPNDVRELYCGNCHSFHEKNTLADLFREAAAWFRKKADAHE